MAHIKILSIIKTKYWHLFFRFIFSAYNLSLSTSIFLHRTISRAILVTDRTMLDDSEDNVSVYLTTMFSTITQ